MRKKKNVFARLTSLLLVLIMTTTTVATAITTIEWPDKLTGFEKTNPVYEDFVELSTTLDALTLPESVRGLVEISDEMDITTFVQVQPTADSSTGVDYYDYYDYGYIQPSDMAQSYETGELVIYSVFYADENGDVGEIGYRVYGYLEGSSTVWFTCDADGSITGAILDVPVEWTGEFDGDTCGEYTFVASISSLSSYTYTGQMPIATVTVYDIDESLSTSCDCEECVAASTSDSATLIHDDASAASVNEISVASVEDSISVMSVEDSISTMAVNGNATSYYQYENGAQMSTVISDYVTSHIASTGNTSNINNVPDSWIDYLNSTWLNVVGSLSTVDGETIWTSQCTWANTSDAELVGGAWTGYGSAEFEYDSTTTIIYSNGNWNVYAAEQLLYAMSNYSAGDTITLQNDIDLNGLNYNWEAIDMPRTVTIDGGGYTIYNLGSYVQVEYGDTNNDGDFNGYDTLQSAFAYFSGSGTYTVTNLNFDTGKLVCDASANLEAFNAETGTDYDVEDITVDYAIFGLRNAVATVVFEDVNVDNYLVISRASSACVLIGMNGTATWYSTWDSTINTEIDVTLTRTITNCSVSNSWVYGHSHTGSLATYSSDSSFTNCYAVGNILISTGYHSGAFVSCLNNSGYFENCFAADNYLYSAMQSGGFVGYGGDAADYVNCYASGVVEGYMYIGGFVGVTSVGHDYVDNTDAYPANSRNYNTFTNCYSTTLVGMRTETNNSGGFVGAVKYMGDNYEPHGATVFDSCYAAGEVGSTQTVNEDNTENVGGFVGYDQTYANDDYPNAMNYTTVYTNCYYDKQTTAMREWVSGRYNSADSDNPYEIDIIGVLTSDSDKYGTGLISEPAEAHTDVYNEDGSYVEDPEFGFIGFSVDADWVYTTEEHYPELSVFSNATDAESGSWANPELVEAYSLASTATVILDTWDYGYEWYEDEDGNWVRTDTKVLYYGTYDGLDDHLADRYTYDTVREIVSNASITSTATFTEMITGGIDTSSYWYDEDDPIEYDEDKEITNIDDLIASDYDSEDTFYLSNTYDSLTVTAPGIEWYDITESAGDETGSRPIRLISFMLVDAGDDQYLTASDYYDHKDDASFTMIDTIKQNMVITLDADETWATSMTQIYPENTSFYAVDTVDTQFTASSSAWINTEIWRAELVTWDLIDGNFTQDPDDSDRYSYTDTDGSVHWFTVGQDGVIYYEETTEDGTVMQELYAGESYVDDNGDTILRYYTAEYSVNLNGLSEDEDVTVTQAKWNGIIPLYPDMDETQYYIIRYYWVLGNGRYRSDYKIIEITDEDIVLERYNLDINVYNEIDDSENDSVMAVYASGYGEDATSKIPTFADITSSSYATTSTTDDDGNEVKSVAYGEDSYVSWVQEDDYSVVTKTVLTMTANNGFEAGTTTTVGEIAVGDTIELPIESFYLVYTYDDDDGSITGQATESQVTTVTYTVQADSGGGLYLEFDQAVTDSADEAVLFEDTSYNITFDIYVEEVTQINVTKIIDNFDEDVDDGMDEQSFIIGVAGTIDDADDEQTSAWDVQTVLVHEQTSSAIRLAVDTDGSATFFVEETVPMEFSLVKITYTVNGGEAIDYDEDDGITINHGDVVAITVTNTFTAESYFKARDEVTNTFTADSSEIASITLDELIEQATDPANA